MVTKLYCRATATLMLPVLAATSSVTTAACGQLKDAAAAEMVPSLLQQMCSRIHTDTADTTDLQWSPHTPHFPQKYLKQMKLVSLSAVWAVT